jgi:hypothetical protein
MAASHNNTLRHGRVRSWIKVKNPANPAALRIVEEGVGSEAHLSRSRLGTLRARQMGTQEGHYEAADLDVGSEASTRAVRSAARAGRSGARRLNVCIRRNRTCGERKASSPFDPQETCAALNCCGACIPPRTAKAGWQTSRPMNLRSRVVTWGTAFASQSSDHRHEQHPTTLRSVHANRRRVTRATGDDHAQLKSGGAEWSPDYQHRPDHYPVDCAADRAGAT